VARYAVFIDAGYLRAVLTNFGEPRISYKKLSEFFAQGDERLRTYYYDCAPFQGNPPTSDEKERKRRFDRFLNYLQTGVPRFQERLGRLQRIQDMSGTPKFTQKKVDVLLTVDLVRLSCEKQIQRAVLIAGDSDFVPAIQVARDAGTIVQLYHSTNPRPHDELLKVSDDRIVIDDAFIKKVSEGRE
jgi:uncharacterized LabA/DUF88 family protein